MGFYSSLTGSFGSNVCHFSASSGFSSWRAGIEIDHTADG